MTDATRYDVFLSYSHRDRAWAMDLRKNLKRSGVKVFVDAQSIDRTEEIERQIRAALERSDHLLLVLSPDAIASPWVRKEIRDRPRPILLARTATAPLPRDITIDDDCVFDFEPAEEGVADYQQHYRDAFERLCRKLGKKPERPRGNRIHPSVGYTPGALYDRALDLLVHVLAWPATRKGLCVMLGLPAEALETDRDDRRMAANYLVHRVALERGLPGVRACRIVMQTVKEGCRLEEPRALELDRLVADIEDAVQLKVDDDFVQKVLGALGEDRYGIREIVGGSFTIVMRARDHDLNRDVVVKVLRPRPLVSAASGGGEGKTALQPQEVTGPFQYYAQVAADVEHTAFPRVHGARFTRELSLVISDYSRGTPLASLLRLEREPSATLVATLLDAIGAALEHLEKKGLVHTCLNPENMFVDREGTVRISPFGIARVNDEITPMPRLYELAGCPSRKAGLYCGPEEQTGYRAQRHAHQFGLGLIATELLSGRCLDLELGVRGKDRIGTSALAHAEAGDRWGGARWPRALVPVIGRLLDPDPDRRYQDARAACCALLDAMASDLDVRPAEGEQCHLELRAMLREVARESRLRRSAAEDVRRSVPRVLTGDFLRAFHEALMARPEVADVFDARWRELDRGEAQREYFRKVRLALRTIIDYGAYPAYESLGLELVVATHARYGVRPELYQVFTDTLLETLEGLDPPFGDAARSDALREAWKVLTSRALEFVQGKARFEGSAGERAPGPEAPAPTAPGPTAPGPTAPGLSMSVRPSAGAGQLAAADA